MREDAQAEPNPEVWWDASQSWQNRCANLLPKPAAPLARPQNFQRKLPRDQSRRILQRVSVTHR